MEEFDKSLLAFSCGISSNEETVQLFFTPRPDLANYELSPAEKRVLLDKTVELFAAEVELAESNPDGYLPIARPEKKEVKRLYDLF